MTDVAVRGLTVEFPSTDYAIRPLDDLDLDARSGELVLVLGPSGCGKTTLLSCLAGILTPTKGHISVDGRDVTSLTGEALTQYRRHTVGVVFQAFNLIPSLTALENVMVPLRMAGVAPVAARERSIGLLSRVGLGQRMHHRPAKLSGGQQQRVAIARALVHDPPLVLADEPTAHLDFIQVESILKLIRSLAVPGRLVLAATHDERMVPLADRVIELVPRPGADAVVAAVERTLAPGEVLFSTGDASDLVYVVEEGEVDIVRRLADGAEETLAVIGPGRYFGELGPVLGLPRSATARARVASRVTGLGVRAFRDRVGGDTKLRALLGSHEAV